MSNITFVTYFFDINRPDAPQINSTFSLYMTWLVDLFAQPVNLYFYTTQEIYNKLPAVTKANVYFKIVNNLAGIKYLQKSTDCWNKYQTNNPIKDTAYFCLLMHAKFLYLKKAIKENKFNSTHFAWIDSGLFKIATHKNLLSSLIPSDKIKCLIMNYIDKQEVDKDDFVLSCKYKIAGGFFTANKENMLFLCNQVRQLFKNLAEKNIYGLEQEYISIVYSKHREYFDPYYGDFCDLINNYQTCNNNIWLPLRFIDTAHNKQNIIDRDHAINYLLHSPISHNYKEKLKTYK